MMEEDRDEWRHQRDGMMVHHLDADLEGRATYRHGDMPSAFGGFLYRIMPSWDHDRWL
jgi:hypothetical protein